MGDLTARTAPSILTLALSERKLRMRSFKHLYIVLTLFMMFLAGDRTLATADESEMQPTPSEGEESAMSSQDIEMAIHALAQPIDQERLRQIFSQLGQIADPQEQGRLRELLDHRMQELPMDQERAAESPPAISTEPQANFNDEITPDRIEEDLRMRIETLMVGPTATTDDIRARDELVATIADFPDPIKRDELLKRLEERERQAEELNGLSGDSSY